MLKRKSVTPLNRDQMEEHIRPEASTQDGILVCHITPTDTIPLMARAYDGPFMALHHLCEENSKYEKHVGLLPANVYIYLDNSAFELGQSCTVPELIEAGHRIKANCLVAPDGFDTVDAYKIREAGFDVMVVPAGDDMLSQAMLGLGDDKVTFVGIAYLHAVTYMRKLVEEPSDITDDMLRDVDLYDALQNRKYTDADPRAREDFLTVLSWLKDINTKKLHMLGATTVDEFARLRRFSPSIYSWDTSMAVWSSYSLVAVSDLHEKFAKPVDFKSKETLSALSTYNIGYIEGLLHAYPAE